MSKGKDRSIRIIELFSHLNQYSQLLEATWAEIGPEKAFQELQDKYKDNYTVMKGIVDRQLGRANKIKDNVVKTKSIDVISKIQKLLSEKEASDKSSQHKDSGSKDSESEDEEAVHHARVRAAQHVSKEGYDAAAEALSKSEPRTQRHLVSHIRAEKFKEILTEMTVPQIADLLSILPHEHANSLMEVLDPGIEYSHSFYRH